eukprot:3940520-Prymnesium_polylepis.1
MYYEYGNAGWSRVRMQLLRGPRCADRTYDVRAGPGFVCTALFAVGREQLGVLDSSERETRRKPRWTAKCRFYKR